MQETIPGLEGELESLVAKFLEDEIRSHNPGFGDVERHRVFEGDHSSITRPNGDQDDTIYRESSAASEIPSEKILYSSLPQILACFAPAIKEMAGDQASLFFEVMDNATKKTGNVVDGKGKPISFDLILETLEKIQIDFDQNGDPLMPTMMISPAMRPRLEELMRHPDRDQFERKQKQLIDKKRLEWRDREANRTLVG